MSLAELRARTGPLHERLDQRLQLFTNVQTREEYREHLFRFYRVLFFVERELARFPEWEKMGVRWSERKKCALLQADLAALGAPNESIESPSPPESLPPLATFADSVGSLYVLEGSTLGAQFISRHFGAKLGITANSGMSFHVGYGAETAARWKEFCMAVERFFQESPKEKEQALSAACSAFNAMEAALCERKPIEVLIHAI